jgi:hypothetical protein
MGIESSLGDRGQIFLSEAGGLAPLFPILVRTGDNRAEKGTIPTVVPPDRALDGAVSCGVGRLVSPVLTVLSIAI